MIGRLVGVAALTLFLSGCASAISPESVVSIEGPWAFHPGDDMQWAAREFDDQAWPRLQVPKSWGRQGYDNVFGMAWYRRRVEYPWPADAALGVAIGDVESAYEIYVGGKLVGRIGGLPPTAFSEYDHRAVYSVPPQLREPDGSLSIALRIWRASDSPPGSAGPVEGSFQAGPLLDLVAERTLAESTSLALVFMFVFAALYHLGLWFLRRDTEEYGWFGLLVMEAALYCFLRTQWKYELGISFLVMKKTEHFLLYALQATFVQFLWVFYKEARPRSLRLAQAALLLAGTVVVLAPGLGLARAMLPYLYLGLAVLVFFSLWLVLRRIRQNHREAVLIGIGAVVVAAAFANDAMVERNLYVFPRVGVYGFGVLVVGMSISLASRFTTALKEVESLRRGLEARVEMRTRELSDAYLKMEELALRDGLTGLLNRRALQERAMAGLITAKRKRQPFALALIDIDHFKKVNDTHGHAAGDHVLAELAARLTSGVRAADDVGRWGGEEFMVLFPESNREQAHLAAERLRVSVESRPVTVGSAGVSITVSVGVAVVEEPAASEMALDALIVLADDALYSAKDGGRNQVIVAQANV